MISAEDLQSYLRIFREKGPLTRREFHVEVHVLQKDKGMFRDHEFTVAYYPDAYGLNAFSPRLDEALKEMLDEKLLEPLTVERSFGRAQKQVEAYRLTGAGEEKIGLGT